MGANVSLRRNLGHTIQVAVLPVRGRLQKYSDCLYKQRLNVLFGRKQTFPAIFSLPPRSAKATPKDGPNKYAPASVQGR